MRKVLFIGIPVHVPPPVIKSSPLGLNGWVAVDRHTLETEFENVYAIGDVVNIPIGEYALPKSGAFAQNAATIVVNSIMNRLMNEDNPVRYEGDGTCYVEIGSGGVGRISANFLGGDEPDVSLEGPSDTFRVDKEKFETDRIGRWFK